MIEIEFKIPNKPNSYSFLKNKRKKKIVVDDWLEFIPKIYNEENEEEKNKNFHIDIEFHFLGKEHPDIDNMIKPLLDGMKRRVMPDDKCIKSLSAKILTMQKETFTSVKLNAL